MNSEKQTPLTLLDACTLLARETVSLLEGSINSRTALSASAAP